MSSEHQVVDAGQAGNSTDGQYTLRLLRRFDLRDQAGRSIALPSPAQRVLAFLALHDCPLHRTFVACSLWPDSTESKAFGSLRCALWRLTRTAPGVVDVSPSDLQLGARVAVDLVELLATSRALRDAAPAGMPGLRDLAARFEDELLTDWYDDWVTIWRERWRQARLHALENMARHLAHAGEFDAAVECGLAAIVADPLRESSHRVLIEVHLLEGNRSEALREYDAFRRLLARELGLEPNHDLTELVRPLSARIATR
jgi:DNA-binding SARP family transcriptional activator